MKVRHIILLLLLLNIKTAIAQQYKEIQNEADRKYQAKQYDVAAHLYENAFEIDNSEYRTDNLYNASCSYALSGNKTKAFDCLEKAIDFGWQKIEQANKDTDLNSLKNEIRWQTRGTP
jgi:tetratricopeptide (TPR) repeat protein